MQYLTFDEYQALGGKADAATFPVLEFKARKRIDYMTANRVQAMESVPEAVRLCMMTLMALEEKYGAQTQAENAPVTAFSTDGYSETYATVMSAEQAATAAQDSIRAMLYGETDDKGVPLLYRGLR